MTHYASTLAEPVALDERKANYRSRPDAIAEMSRKWLEGIDPEQFDACHEYLLAVRLARHMSKTDVVAASMINGDPSTGVSLPTVSKIESGTYGEPGFRTMIRLARGYGISASSLERFFV
jgi:hypothetical protein